MQLKEIEIEFEITKLNFKHLTLLTLKQHTRTYYILFNSREFNLEQS